MCACTRRGIDLVGLLALKRALNWVLLGLLALKLRCGVEEDKSCGPQVPTALQASTPSQSSLKGRRRSNWSRRGLIRRSRRSELRGGGSGGEPVVGGVWSGWTAGC